MKLFIKNFAKIKEATVEFNGITVIAGDNNTGKSTVGKILFAFYDAFYDITQKVKEERKSAIHRAISFEFGNFFNDEEHVRNTLFLPNYLQYMKKIKVNDDFDAIDVDEIIQNALGDDFHALSVEDKQQLHKNITARLDKIKEVQDEELKERIIGEYFQNLFNSQINSLSKDGSKEDNAIVTLSIKNKNISSTFYHDQCIEVGQQINLLNKSVYIDDPFIVDTALRKSSLPDFVLRKSSRSELNRRLTQYLNQPKEGHLVEKLLAEKQLEEINEKLKRVVPGEFTISERGDVALKSERLTGTIDIANLSTGIKAFVILKKLLEDDVLKPKDVLILDEPEIHLHPEWQIIYAELIVLLQKYFDLTILLTTHSPYFLKAIDVFAMKHDIKNKCKFYLSNMDWNDNSAYFTDKTDNMEALFEKMANAFTILNSIEDEYR